MKINFIGDKKIISQFNEFLLNQNNFEIIDNLVEKISKVNYENFYYWMGPISSRNQYTTDLYDNLIKIAFLNSLSEKDPNIQIYVDSIFLKIFLNKTFNKKFKINLQLSFLNSIIFELSKNFLFILREILLIIIFKIISFKKLENSSNKVLINCYLINSINDINRYIPLKVVKENNYCLFVNFAVTNPLKIIKLYFDLSKKNINFFSKYENLSLMDFLKEFKELVFFKTKFPEQLFYDGLDYLDLFKISNFQLSYFRSSLGGALNKVSSENLLEREDDLNFFNIGENHNLDRGIHYAFNKSVKNKSLYFLSVPPKKQDRFMFTVESELSAGVTPFDILSSFNLNENDFPRDKNLKLHHFPAIRYEHLFKRKKNNQKPYVSNVLGIFMPYSYEDSEFILNTIFDLEDFFKEFILKVKLHPASKSNKKLEKKLAQYENELHIDRSIDLVFESEFIITGNSGIIIDCMFQNKPCFIFSKSGFPYDFLSTKNSFIWKDKEELKNMVSMKVNNLHDKNTENYFEFIYPSSENVRTKIEEILNL